MDKDTVNIIIPVYNVERYLRKCLNSVRKQTYKNIEVILVDDGSTDKCPQICDWYAGKDSRFKVIHKPNGGVGSARNVGIDYVSNINGGGYILFVDPDDWLPKNAVEVLVRKQKLTGADWVCGSFIYVLPIRNRKDFPFSENLFEKNETEQFQNFILSKKPIRVHSLWGKLYRKDIISANCLRFDTKMKMSEDCLFNYKYIQHCERFAAVTEYVYYYNRLNKNSASNQYFAERNVWKKTFLLERQKCIGDSLEKSKLSDYNNYIIDVFNNLVGGYVGELPRLEATEKIRETHMLFKDMLDKIIIKDCSPDKFAPTKMYFKYETLLKEGKYDQVYEYFYALQASKNSLPGKIKRTINNIMGSVRTFILFGW